MSDDATIDVTLFTDPGCPWGYSALPALTTLEWRYGDQLRWRLVVIGLAEQAQQYLDRGYTALRSAQGRVGFRRYGMPMTTQPKQRMAATARACRALVAARIERPGSEWQVLRALQLATFTGPLLLDDDVQLSRVIDGIDGIDGAALVARLDGEDVTTAYERDRAEARAAAGSPAELQGKTASPDGVVRYTAPSVIFEREGMRLVAGGFQPVEAYDVLVANLCPTLERRAAPGAVADVIDRFPGGLATREIAEIMRAGNEPADVDATELALLELADAGSVVRVALGDDALWMAAGQPASEAAAASLMLAGIAPGA